MPIEPDDDKTVIKGSKPPSSPAPATPALSHNALPIHTRLGEFEITGLIGEGGFGIVYLAQDHSLERRVALKEYMPSALAGRSHGMVVAVKSERFAETFEVGLRSFVNEARLLAQFDHPSLVKVYRFWEANGTAYMVMPYYEGDTLKQRLGAMPDAPSEAWLREVLGQLLEALETIHREKCYHRDIAPDNILLLKNGSPLLLDFGAARRVIGDMTHALTVILKPGYAPVEQYAEDLSMKQGPWTDIYALAAVMYRAIMGRTPPPSVGRMMGDNLEPLVRAAAGRYSDAFLRGLDQALAVKPEERPQTIAEFRDLLKIQSTAAPRTGLPRAEPPPRERAEEVTKRKPFVIIGGLAALGLVAVVLFYFVFGTAPEEATRPASTPVPSTDVNAPAPVTTPAVPTPAPAPVMPAPSEPSTPAAVEPAPATIEPTQPFDLVDNLNRMYEQRNPEHGVVATPLERTLRIGKDLFRFRISSSRAGYLYLFMVGTDRGHFFMLFPNAKDSRNRIDAGAALELPRKGWEMYSDGPAGTNYFLAIVSENPREFSEAGLKKVGWFAEFTLDVAEHSARASAGGPSPFIGRTKCPTQSNCSESYGAAIFTVEETP